MAQREVPRRGATSRRRSTSTSPFGVSRREAHDSSGFYDRFEPPRIIDDDTIAECPVRDSVICADGRRMEALPDLCIALVVTSPPYFAGKEYEAELGERGIPATYLEYLGMLRDVFAECWRVLEPGGRIAVNVANLGRKPYRSLSADVIRILQDDLGFLLRGEILWVKGRGANGNSRVGLLRICRQSRPSRRHRADRHGLQGPFRPRTEQEQAPHSRPSSRGHDRCRRLPVVDSRHVALPSRVGEAHRTPRTLSSRAPETGYRAQHLQRRLRT